MVKFTGKIIVGSKNRVPKDAKPGDMYCFTSATQVKSFTKINKDNDDGSNGFYTINSTDYNNMMDYAGEYEIKSTVKNTGPVLLASMNALKDYFEPFHDGISTGEAAIINKFGIDESEEIFSVARSLKNSFKKIHDSDDKEKTKNQSGMESGEEEEGNLDVLTGTGRNDPGTKRKMDDGDVPTAKKRSNTSDEETFEQSIIDMMEIYDKATDYEGYDPKSVRKTFMAKCPDRNTFINLLMRALMVYVKAGNNPSKLNIKRSEMLNARKIISEIGVLGISKVASDKGTLTLPRIGMAFMTELFIVRKHFCSELQTQVQASCDPIYQDVAFAGCPLINIQDGYSQFYYEFSGLISNRGSGYKSDEIGRKQHEVDVERWIKVATDGYPKDKIVSKRMMGAMAVENKDQGIKFIKESYEKYEAEQSN